MTSKPTNEALREWQHNASHWVKHSETIRTMFAPVTRALIAKSDIRPGQSVIDVAAGAGEPALTIAQHVGESGAVMCTDPVAEMLRVTKPDGTVTLVVWHKSDLSPFCYLITNVMSRHVPSPPADPEAPSAFRFAEPGKLARALTAAGAVAVRELLLEFQIEAPLSLTEFWELRSTTSGTLREKLATLPPAEVQQIASEAKEAVSPFFPNNRMNFPAKMILVTGKTQS